MESPFEKSLNRLVNIVEKLENEEVTLDESLSLYKEGIALSLECHSTLTHYESEVLVLQKEAEGLFSTAAFDTP